MTTFRTCRKNLLSIKQSKSTSFDMGSSIIVGMSCLMKAIKDHQVSTKRYLIILNNIMGKGDVETGSIQFNVTFVQGVKFLE